MTRTVIVQAQQKWEYRIVNKHTETTLLGELNEVGKSGWELVSASYNRDLKGVSAWTAILKRPLFQQADSMATADAVSEPAPQVAVAAPADTLQGFDLSGDEFDFKMPEPLAKPTDDPSKTP